MSDDALVTHCAPTLAGLKTGSLFNTEFRSDSELCSELRAFNRRFAPKGLVALSVRSKAGHALIYVFRPAALAKDLKNEKAINILKCFGYEDFSTSRALAQLKRRLSSCDCFPHEIGLFLGYPPEDVKGFIDNRAENYKFSGYWKVYGDEEAAQRTFDRYKKCTGIYRKLLRNGTCLDRLISAV